MARRRLIPALLLVALLVALAGSSGATIPNANLLPPLPGDVVAVSATVRDATYPVYNGKGKRTGSRTWAVSDVGGNCCETRLATTSRGRLLEFGGTDLLVSEDEGQTWSKVAPKTPLVGGEGDVVAAPNGDIVAVGWDVYGGDRLQSYKYTAATRKWEVGEVLIRSPLFDRPWLTLVPGPLSTTLGTVPYGVVLEGGIATFGKAVYFSSDGLRYDEMQVPAVDDALADPVRAPLTTTKNPDADYWGAAAPVGSASLAGKGGTYIRVDNGSCPVMRIIPPSTRLVCDSEQPQQSTLRQDSSGALIRTYTLDPERAVLEVSRDAGRTWRAVLITPPVNGVFERASADNPKGWFHDLAVNGKLGFAAVMTRVARPTSTGQSLSQDLVAVIDTTTRFPVIREWLFVGVGGLNTRGGLDPQYSGPRLDFQTVSILPSGRIATGYMDTTSEGGPSIAIEQDVRRGRGGVIR